MVIQIPADQLLVLLTRSGASETDEPDQKDEAAEPVQ